MLIKNMNPFVKGLTEAFKADISFSTKFAKRSIFVVLGFVMLDIYIEPFFFFRILFFTCSHNISTEKLR